MLSPVRCMYVILNMHDIYLMNGRSIHKMNGRSIHKMNGRSINKMNGRSINKICLPLNLHTAIYIRKITGKEKCNQSINVLLADKRKVYSWGRADYGQLGREVQHQYDPIPQPISGLDDVTCIQCGSEHNLALSGKYF